MKKRGRKSATDLALVRSLDVRRPSPPARPIRLQRDLWRTTVAAMPPDWVRPDLHELLAATVDTAPRDGFSTHKSPRSPLTASSALAVSNLCEFLADARSRDPFGISRCQSVADHCAEQHQARWGCRKGGCCGAFKRTAVGVQIERPPGDWSEQCTVAPSIAQYVHAL